MAVSCRARLVLATSGHGPHRHRSRPETIPPHAARATVFAQVRPSMLAHAACGCCRAHLPLLALETCIRSRVMRIAAKGLLKVLRCQSMCVWLCRCLPAIIAAGQEAGAQGTPEALAGTQLHLSLEHCLHEVGSLGGDCGLRPLLLQCCHRQVLMRLHCCWRCGIALQSRAQPTGWTPEHWQLQ